MKLIPQQAPLYGKCVITVQLDDEELSEDEEGSEYFLLFAGSTQTHLTSTLRSSHDALRALCPAHDCCETVQVTLCCVKRDVATALQDPGVCPGRVAPLAEHHFSFVQDLAFDMAQFLVSTAGRTDGLEGALLLDECQIPLQECERLDESLALALHHLKLPPGWSLLGSKLTNSTEPEPQETLLHFAARRGLRRVAHFLLQQSGATEALRLVNRQGHTPAGTAELRGHTELQQLLTQTEADTETDRGTETVQPVPTDARVVCHLPRLNTHTLTVGPYPGRDPPTLQRSVEQLRHFICHLHAKGVPSLELQSESLHTAPECCDGVETETACLERVQLQSDGLETSSQSYWTWQNPGGSSPCGGGGEAQKPERDHGSSLGPPTSERPPDHALGSPEDRECLSPNTVRDYWGKREGRREEEEEEEEEEARREQPVVARQSLSVSDRSEGTQGETEGGYPATGAPVVVLVCGEQPGETDRGQAVIWEGQGAKEGRDRSDQEGQGVTEGRDRSDQGEQEATEGRDRSDQGEQEATEGRDRSDQGEQEATEGRDRSDQGEQESTESRDRTTCSGDTRVSAMGQTQSSELSDASDTSNPDMKEESEDAGKEEVQDKQELCDSLSLDEEKPENEGLTDSAPTTADQLNSSLIDPTDIMQEVMSESTGLSPVIEGLHEGEPPPDINSLEQNQETAARDYSTEEQQDWADGSSHLAQETGCHSVDFAADTGAARSTELDVSVLVDEQATVDGAAVEGTRLPLSEPDHPEEMSAENASDVQTACDSMDNTRTDHANFEASLEIMPSSGMAHSLSSDEEDSFQSVNSSTTEIFHLTQETDGPNMEYQELIQNKMVDVTSVGIKIAKQNDVEPNENTEYSLSEDSGLPLEQSMDVLNVTDCVQALVTSPGTEPESQPSLGLHTIEALRLGQTVASEPSAGESSLGPESSLDPESAKNDDAQTVEVIDNDCETVDGDHSDLNLQTVGTYLRSEVIGGRIVAEGGDVTSPAEVDPPANGDTDLQLVLRQSREDNPEMTPNEGLAECDADEGLRPCEIQISVSSPEDMAPALDVDPQGAVEPPPGVGASSEVFDPEGTVYTADGTSSCTSCPVQEMDILVCEDVADCPGHEEEDGPGEEDVSMIHRDKEACLPAALSSSPQPSAAPRSHGRRHTGSSHSSVVPSLSSSSSVFSPTHRDSGSDTESFLCTEPGDDGVFRKGDDPLTGGDSTSEVSVSCSSTEDTVSVGPPSSSSESCLEGVQGLTLSWSPEESTQTGANTAVGPGGGGGGGGETEDEAKDRLTEVPRRSSLLRTSIRSLSPLRRHSWGPGKNSGGDAEMNQRRSIHSPGAEKPTFHRRSYSLEGLSGDVDGLKGPSSQRPRIQEAARASRQENQERGSLLSLTEGQEDGEEAGERRGAEEQKMRRYRPLRHSCPSMSLPLTKSISMLAISHRDIDAVGHLRRKRRISFSFNLSPILTKSKSQFLHGDTSSSDEEDNLSMRSFSSASGSLAYSISEEEPGPLRSDSEGKSGTKVSRTFSYLKNKMYRKSREKEREKRAEKDRETKEKDKRLLNGHLFAVVSSTPAALCLHCNKSFNAKDVFHCSYCNASVHKSCRDGLPVCTRGKTKQFADSSSFTGVTMRNKSAGTRERPWSAILSPDDHSSLVNPSSRRHTSIMPFHGNNLSKSLSISNIAGPVFDDMPIKGLRYLSQSTDSLNRTNQVTESMESLTDEGTEMMDGQLMGEFEADVKELEADSWSLTVDQAYLQQLRKDLVKRQDVIYELIQTEMHHVRTLRIMSEVYSKGLQKEVQLEVQTQEKLFPVLDELLELHTQHLLRLLERKKEGQQEGSEGGFVINRIGDILVSQFSGSNAETMKRVYGKFCSRHNEAVNLYKELLTKDKRFQTFIKRKMSSSVVRRLGIPECILLVTQRITKYPVLIQRMLQHTKESEEDYEDLTESVRLVKEVITAVDTKVNDQEKKRRLRDVYSRTDSKSIMRMKSGQMFAREDLVRGRKLIHDGPLQLKNAQGRLKDVQALLLSDLFVFLQEKDQKFVFASLDQRSTVLSLQKLIVREVANEERGLFLITAGMEKPEMVEILASSKEERNTWRQLIQDAMHSIEKDEDEGIPSETEEDKRQLETKAKEMREMLRQKDVQIVALLEEKVQVFREMCECVSPGEEQAWPAKTLFRAASSQEPSRGEPIMKDALQEVETLQALVNGSLGGAMAVGQQVAGVQEGGGAGGGGAGVGPVCLPRRAETFGGFDSHQMKSSKSGDRGESEDTAVDLRRTESDSVLKKGGNANLLLLLKRNSEQVLHSVSHLHDLLSTLQAVVVQQDSFIEDQRQALSERSSSTTSLSSSSSRPSSRPNSLIEQEKQRSLEKQRQELASLQRQQAAHAEERRRREKDWEQREQQLTTREALLHVQEEETGRRGQQLVAEQQELQSKKEEYQRDLERLRDAQRKLERDRDALQRDVDRMEQIRLAERVMERTSSSASDESLFPGSSASLEREPADRRDSPSGLQPRPAKSRGKSLNPFSSGTVTPGLKGGDSHGQVPNRLLQLAKSKDRDRKEKKRKKAKGAGAQITGSVEDESCWF